MIGGTLMCLGWCPFVKGLGDGIWSCIVFRKKTHGSQEFHLFVLHFFYFENLPFGPSLCICFGSRTLKCVFMIFFLVSFVTFVCVSFS